MEMVEVKLPKSLVISTITAELSSFAYNTSMHTIMYIKGFNYDDNGQVVTDMETYPIEESDSITRFFDMKTGMGVTAIDTRALVDDPKTVSNTQIKKYASMIEELHNFIQRSSVKKNDTIPIFNTPTPDTDEEESPKLKNLSEAYKRMHEAKNEKE